MSAPTVLVITGGTGSGKSTLAGWLAERGAFVIDADRVGHEILAEPDVAAAVVEAFGNAVKDPRGGIDRSVLGPLVFASAEALTTLNRIVHPPLVAELKRRVELLQRSHAARLIVVDAALHFQFQPPLPCDAVLFTVASPEERCRRIMARDGVEKPQAVDRLARQAHLEAFQSAADAVLDTEREPEQVRGELLAWLDERFGLDLVESDPPRPE